MKIDTLIPDIYALIQRKDGWFNEELSQRLSSDIASRLTNQLGEGARTPTLRLSRMGPSCPKALWCSIHRPDLADPLPPWAQIKYSFGHIIEGLAVALAKASGHSVTGEQHELVLDSIVGHRDCVIDGCTVDVKSSASISFNKFRSGSFVDTFGYLDQLDGYVLAAANDPLVTEKRKGYLLVVDKQLGHMCLYPHEVTDERERTLRERIAAYRRIIALPNPPLCECGTITQEATGNVQLDLKAGYSSYKHACHPGLRTFLFAKGPVFFTSVKKKPFNKDGPIVEVDKTGKIVYN